MPTLKNKLDGLKYLVKQVLIGSTLLLGLTIATSLPNHILNFKNPINYAFATNIEPGQECLVGHWTFDNADIISTSTDGSTIILDKSGNGNNGLVNTFTVPTTGQIGQAYTFNGNTNASTQSYIDLGDSPTLAVTSSYSMSVWTKWENVSSTAKRHIFRKSGNYGFSMYQGINSTQIACSFHPADLSKYPTVTSTANINDGQWHHTLCVYDGNQMKMWTDGTVTYGDYSNDVPVYENQNATIGRGANETPRPFQGSMDDFRIYNCAIPTSTVLNIYNQGVSATEPTNPLSSSNLTLRFEDQIIWTGTVNLTTTSYTDQINSSTYYLNTSTVFSTLVLADQQSDSFNISDAQYNAGFDSFYLACINVSSTSTNNACYNWNYVVNNNYPSVGMDKYLLNGGENIYVYFSNPWKITATTSTFPIDTTTTLQTWRYQFDNLLEPWVLDPDHLVDISIPNPTPTGWWDQTITVTTTQTNSSGTIDYKFSATGTYYAKIVSLDWTKWSNPITLIAQEVNTTTQTNTSTNDQTSNSGGSGSAPAISTNEINNAIQKILNFLKSKQSDNGSIIDLQMSDWAAMSFGANNIYAGSIRTTTFSLYDYLNTTFVTSTTQTLNNCTEYARHILGLLSSGFNKTNTQIVDLKNKIKTECLAEGQVGQAGINDDIFILLALLATDESATSEIVQTSVSAIKADQQPNGAFTWDGWAGQDVTGAAINALRYASTFGIAVDDLIFQNAKTYLQNTQLSDGGWGFSTSSDPLTTSWAMYGINALGEGQAQWTNSSNQNPWTALINKLGNTDYYTSPWSADGIDWFATKHAVPALLGKSWPIILTPITEPSSGDSGGSSNNTLSTSTEVASIITTTTIGTSTISTPTTTAEITTTTNENNFGQILGMKIESEEPQTKIAGQKIVRSQAAINTDINKEPTTTLSEDNNQTTNKQTKIVQTENNTNSPAREMIKKLLMLCVLSASIIGVYLGFKSIKK